MTVMAEISSQSSLAEAVGYTLGHRDGLTAFLDDGRIEADTNTVERTMGVPEGGRSPTGGTPRQWHTMANGR